MGVHQFSIHRRRPPVKIRRKTRHPIEPFAYAREQRAVARQQNGVRGYLQASVGLPDPHKLRMKSPQSLRLLEDEGFTDRKQVIPVDEYVFHAWRRLSDG